MKPLSDREGRPSDPTSVSGRVSGFRIDLADALNFDSSKIEYVIPGLPRGCVGGLVGPGGAGKSTFVLQLASEICCGAVEDVLIPGLSETLGDVLYVSAEDPKEIIFHRINCLINGMSGEQRGNLFRRLRVWIPPSRFDICDPVGFREILGQARGVRLVILDPLSRVHRASENCNRQMSDVMESISDLAVESGAAVLFVHHTMKFVSEEMIPQYAGRGAGCISDSSRWLARLYIGRQISFSMGKGEGGKESICFELVKSNYLAPGMKRFYKRSSAGCINPDVRIDLNRSRGKKAAGTSVSPRSVLDEC